MPESSNEWAFGVNLAHRTCGVRKIVCQTDHDRAGMTKVHSGSGPGKDVAAINSTDLG